MESVRVVRAGTIPTSNLDWPYSTQPPDGQGTRRVRRGHQRPLGHV